MKLRIPLKIIERWTLALQEAGSIEIGGVLFGEQIDVGDFRVVNITHQKLSTGTATSFKRNGQSAKTEVLAFHKKLGNNPKRFNYLGEWHSHPTVPVIPSVQDEITMSNLIQEQQGAVNFLVLIIVKIDENSAFEIAARTFLSSGHQLPCKIEIEYQTSSMNAYENIQI